MANPEHLAILKQGVEAWNRWRRSMPGMRPDLRAVEFGGARLKRALLNDADLSDAALKGASFRQSNLKRAILRRADLRTADLAAAYLEGADLTQTHLAQARLEKCTLKGASLRWAKLYGASLREADLTDAVLAEAHLEGADLTQATVENADLGKAFLGGTKLIRVELLGARRLESVRHLAPSLLSADTLWISSANLPRAFLQGVGLPDSMIDHVLALAESPAATFYSAFISYSHSDTHFARRLHDQLQARGIRCWLDETQLKIGDEILPGVLGAIRLHDRVILCCSEASLNSGWVETELEETFEKEQKEGRSILLPLNLDGYLLEGWEGPLAVKVRKRLAADFTGWEQDNAKFEEQFERVVGALRAE